MHAERSRFTIRPDDTPVAIEVGFPVARYPSRHVQRRRSSEVDQLPVEEVIQRRAAILRRPSPKAGPGRPKLAKGRAKAHIVPVRFTPELLKRIEHAAKANGQNVSEWIRSTLGVCAAEE